MINPQSPVAACLHALRECEYACRFCTDACAADAKSDLLGPCIRASQDCVAACVAAIKLLKDPSPDRQALDDQLRTCIAACEECVSESDGQASNLEQCAHSAEACRACAAACEAVLARPA